MNHPYHNQTFIDAPDACYHTTLTLNHDYINSVYPIEQEPTSSCAVENRSKSPELKFKIESVGIHPKDDDDLDMCPARVRSGWPEKIIPWWIPLNDHEKPPYSYATLIAHAILSSKDGRLTLNDIYVWLSKNYPTFVLGVGGWQNSIRHNLSLNKKWFVKIDRRPTQANPGKGCYWTLVEGKEHIFITNLTQEGGYTRKHHDVGLTTELSLGQRRGFYSDTMLTTPPLTPTKPEMSLYTTFRMASPTKKRPRRKIASSPDESEYDSGVDLSSEYVDQKRRRASSPGTESHLYSSTDMLAFPQMDWSWTDPFACFVKQPDPLSQKYLHFGDDSALIQPTYSSYNLYPPNPFVSMQDILYS